MTHAGARSLSDKSRCSKGDERAARRRGLPALHRHLARRRTTTISARHRTHTISSVMDHFPLLPPIWSY